MPLVKMTVKEAADKLHEKGVISGDDCELLKKEAAGFNLGAFMAKNQKNIMPALGTASLMGLGASALKEALTPLVQRFQASSSLNKLMEKVPALEGKDPDQIKDYFKVVQTFSPKAASNPLVAGALVNKMMEFGGVDHKLVQDIAAIQAGAAPAKALESLSGVAAKQIFSGDGGPQTMNVNLSGSVNQ